MKILLKASKAVCRTPIKPVIRHRAKTDYQRHSKHKNDNCVLEHLSQKDNQKMYEFEELTKVMQEWINPNPTVSFRTTIVDAGDGSGDGILTFPDGLCEKLGWKENDSLIIEANDGVIRLTKKD